MKRIATETGAGQWGSALAFACNFFGLTCTVYMVKVSYEQKPYRKSLMHVWGAEVYPSPTNLTEAGRSVLAIDPDCPGSLGIAISEAVQDTVTSKNTKYSRGSVLNHVLLHQTITGLESIKQFEMIDDYPDVVIGCVGGGSNMGDSPCRSWPAHARRSPEEEHPRGRGGTKSLPHNHQGGVRLRLRRSGADDTCHAHVYPRPRFHPGGHPCGRAPVITACPRFFQSSRMKKRSRRVAYHQNECYEAAVTLPGRKGSSPRRKPPMHQGGLEEALVCKKTGEAKTIAFLLQRPRLS